MITGRNGKELTRAGKLAHCANHAVSRLKVKYYEEYRQLYEEELKKAGISFSGSYTKLLMKENQRLREQLAQQQVSS